MRLLSEVGKGREEWGGGRGREVEEQREKEVELCIP